MAGNKSILQVARLYRPLRHGAGMATFRGHQNNTTDQRRWAHQNLAVKQRENNSTEEGIQSLLEVMHTELSRTSSKELEELSGYYFNAGGKFIRPTLTLTMGGAVNVHLGVNDPEVERLQQIIAVISEMWHTSSLVHDDVIDKAESRRGQQSVNQRWGAYKSVMAGSYILGVGSKLLAQTKDVEVVMAMSNILHDLVSGEFQQMGSREDDEDRFQLYLDKTFNKTASLMANSCKAVALLSGPDSSRVRLTDGLTVADSAYMYGRNIGLAFQLIDDWLDFVASADQLGKPAGADLQLGLATAPVLFASREFPHLKQLILRQFSGPGDVQEAFETVLKSRGLDQTKDLAKKYAEMALDNISDLKESPDKEKLKKLANSTVHRCS